MVLGGYAAVRHDAAGTDALLSCRLVAIRPAEPLMPARALGVTLHPRPFDCRSYLLQPAIWIALSAF